jgi:hypothetical protein
MWLQGWISYSVVALLGLMVGSVELAQRYADTAARFLTWPAAWLYLVTNAFAAALALILVHTLNWSFGQTGNAVEIVQVLVAGCGAMALFRARLFTTASSSRGAVKFVRSPATLLEGLLLVSDRQARRTQARDRIRATQRMKFLTWTQAEELAHIVIIAMSIGGADEREFAKDFKALVKNPEGLSDELRVQLLSVAILKFAGPRVILDAIEHMKPPAAFPRKADRIRRLSSWP